MGLALQSKILDFGTKGKNNPWQSYSPAILNLTDDAQKVQEACRGCSVARLASCSVLTGVPCCLTSQRPHRSGIAAVRCPWHVLILFVSCLYCHERSTSIDTVETSFVFEGGRSPSGWATSILSRVPANPPLYQFLSFLPWAFSSVGSLTFYPPLSFSYLPFYIACMSSSVW